MPRYALPVCLAVLVVLVLLGAGSVVAQHPSLHKPPLALEDRLREGLRKLDGWDLMQLLRTEREIDEQQKQRARASTDPEELALLSEDEDVGVRFAVAANPHTGTEVLMRLAGDPAAAVRAGVAMGVTQDLLAPPQVQERIRQMARQLAADPQPLVRLALAGNPALEPETCDLVAQDADPVIRQKLAENPVVTEAVLRLLAGDSLAAVQRSALLHRSAPADVLEAWSTDPRPSVRLAVCQNPSTPPLVLEQLAQDPDAAVRRAVAAHPATPVQALRRLARDSQIDIVVEVARHPNADRDLLMDLSVDPRDASVRVAAQAGLVPLLRAEIREDVLERWESP